MKLSKKRADRYVWKPEDIEKLPEAKLERIKYTCRECGDNWEGRVRDSGKQTCQFCGGKEIFGISIIEEEMNEKYRKKNVGK